MYTVWVYALACRDLCSAIHSECEVARHCWIQIGWTPSSMCKEVCDFLNAAFGSNCFCTKEVRFRGPPRPLISLHVKDVVCSQRPFSLPEFGQLIVAVTPDVLGSAWQNLTHYCNLCCLCGGDRAKNKQNITTLWVSCNIFIPDYLLNIVDRMINAC